MRSLVRAGVIAALLVLPASASAQETKLSIGISGWTGFAPLTWQGSRHVKEERARCQHQEDPAEGPPPGDRIG